jgi:hypothetical protein
MRIPSITNIVSVTVLIRRYDVRDICSLPTYSCDRAELGAVYLLMSDHGEIAQTMGLPWTLVIRCFCIVVFAITFRMSVFLTHKRRHAPATLP